MDLKTS